MAAKSKMVQTVIPATEAPSEGLVKFDATTKASLVTEKSTGSELLEAIRDMTIEDQADLDLAAEALADAKGNFKRLEERKKTVTDPLTTAINEVRSWFKPAQDVYKEVEGILKEKIAAYHTKRDAENRKALQAAADAHAAGSFTEVGAALSTISTPEKIAGLSVRDAWTFEVVSIEMVPREYLYVNETLVKAQMKKTSADSPTGEPEPIPGIRFIKTALVTSRAT